MEQSLRDSNEDLFLDLESSSLDGIATRWSSADGIATRWSLLVPELIELIIEHLLDLKTCLRIRLISRKYAKRCPLMRIFDLARKMTSPTIKTQSLATRDDYHTVFFWDKRMHITSSANRNGRYDLVTVQARIGYFSIKLVENENGQMIAIPNSFVQNQQWGFGPPLPNPRTITQEEFISVMTALRITPSWDITNIARDPNSKV